MYKSAYMRGIDHYQISKRNNRPIPFTALGILPPKGYYNCSKLNCNSIVCQDVLLRRPTLPEGSNEKMEIKASEQKSSPRLPITEDNKDVPKTIMH